MLLREGGAFYLVTTDGRYVYRVTVAVPATRVPVLGLYGLTTARSHATAFDVRECDRPRYLWEICDRVERDFGVIIACAVPARKFAAVVQKVEGLPCPTEIVETDIIEQENLHDFRALP